MTALGMIITVLLALVALVFTGILLVSGWKALRDELLPGSRVDPPGPGALGLLALGMVLPILLIAAFSAYLALWLLGMFMATG